MLVSTYAEHGLCQYTECTTDAHVVTTSVMQDAHVEEAASEIVQAEANALLAAQAVEGVETVGLYYDTLVSPAETKPGVHIYP